MDENKQEVQKEYRDKFGFLIEEDLYNAIQQHSSIYDPILNQREKEWQTFLQKKNIDITSKKFKKLVRLGVPNEKRGQIWKLCLSVEAKKEMNKGKYESLLKEVKEYKEKPLSLQQIELDIERTYPGHPFFESEEGREKLRNVLSAFALHNKEIGYCQGKILQKLKQVNHNHINRQQLYSRHPFEIYGRGVCFLGIQHNRERCTTS